MPMLRYPIALLNVAMAISAISHANHYLVDVLAGLTISAICIVVVRNVERNYLAQKICRAWTIKPPATVHQAA